VKEESFAEFNGVYTFLQFMMYR